MKKLFAMLMVLALVLGSAAMAEELSYDGQVVAGETVPVAAPFGGRMGEVKLRAGDPVDRVRLTCFQSNPVVCVTWAFITSPTGECRSVMFRS